MIHRQIRTGLGNESVELNGGTSMIAIDHLSRARGQMLYPNLVILQGNQETTTGVKIVVGAVQFTVLASDDLVGLFPTILVNMGTLAN